MATLYDMLITFEKEEVTKIWEKKAQSGDAEKYQKYFEKLLKKYGVDSPAELDDEQKKKFFDEVDKGWKAEGEKSESIGESIDKKTYDNLVKLFRRAITGDLHSYGMLKTKLRGLQDDNPELEDIIHYVDISDPDYEDEDAEKNLKTALKKLEKLKRKIVESTDEERLDEALTIEEALKKAKPHWKKMSDGAWSMNNIMAQTQKGGKKGDPDVELHRLSAEVMMLTDQMRKILFGK